MEGIRVNGIRRALNIPRRYAIPIIVSTGNAYRRPVESSDDVGMDHGRPGTKAATPRYDKDEMIFGEQFGQPIPQA